VVGFGINFIDSFGSVDSVHDFAQLIHIGQYKFLAFILVFS
jgi:hypothetical protein